MLFFFSGVLVGLVRYQPMLLQKAPGGRGSKEHRIVPTSKILSLEQTIVFWRTKPSLESSRFGTKQHL